MNAQDSPHQDLPQQPTAQPKPEPGDTFAVFVGIDWAHEKHAICLIEPKTEKILDRKTIENTPEAMHHWISRLLADYADKGTVAVALEKYRGALLYALMQHPSLRIYPLANQVVCKMQEALKGAGAKSDAVDSEILALILCKFHKQLPVWKPDDVQTRQLGALCRDRRKAIAHRTRLCLQINALLKATYPFALELLDNDCQSPLAADLLTKWPDLQSLQKAGPTAVRKFFYGKKFPRMDKIKPLIDNLKAVRPLTTDPAIIEPAKLQLRMLCAQLRAILPYINDYDRQIRQLLQNHPDAEIFTSLPGAGAVHAPKLLCAFGTDRSRYSNCTDFSSYTGIAPVTRASGKMRYQKRRYACSKYLLQCFHEFAKDSTRFCPWAKAYLQTQLDAGKKYHTAVRALAFKWIRIIYACWKNHTPYNEELYLKALQKQSAPIATKL